MAENKEGFAPKREEIRKETPKASIAAPVPEAKPKKAEPPKIAPKPSKEEMEAAVSSRAQGIANKLPGRANPQAKVDATGVENAVAARARMSANKFLANRANRNA